MAFFVESTASLYSVMILQSGMTISISFLEALLEHQNLSVDKRILDKDMHLRPSLPRSCLLLVLIPHLQVHSFVPCCWWHQVMCLALYAAVAGPMHRFSHAAGLSELAGALHSMLKHRRPHKTGSSNRIVDYQIKNDLSFSLKHQQN